MKICGDNDWKKLVSKYEDINEQKENQQEIYFYRESLEIFAEVHLTK